MTDPYEAVLLDLRAKRDQIDQTIMLLTAMRTGGSVSTENSVTHSQESTVPDAGAYLGMSIVDAAKKLLGMRKRAMPNADIYAELKAGGLVLTGADPVNVISSVLTRRFNQVGDVVRVSRGTWGLKEWYPNRSFKPAEKQATAPDPGIEPAPEENGFEVQVNDLGGNPFA
ncbi:hypothetical protein ASE85_17695 [Sphingobium sp. Leaf26]|uniref:winged helix-turn-helix domain-containing protein n=1 Tax=Sphingobium sp. Leaf26 TaxID=1735693 RepID=UPI0006F768FA|nr:winged helix-turn-helix domain-containing protein [Sphingobium sp. Leaf26]KQN08055.1 hypothetical protein ASE85_17695 [Sphingobium sp. Leaf26]